MFRVYVTVSRNLNREALKDLNREALRDPSKYIKGTFKGYVSKDCSVGFMLAQQRFLTYLADFSG